MITEVVFKDWPLPGPRAVAWCTRFVEKQSGPVAHHRKWVTSYKLQATDHGVTEHGHGMKAFR